MAYLLLATVKSISQTSKKKKEKKAGISIPKPHSHTYKTFPKSGYQYTKVALIHISDFHKTRISVYQSHVYVSDSNKNRTSV